MTQPRLLTCEEFMAMPWGHGWEEMVCPPEPGESDSETEDLEECCWVGNHVAFVESGHGYKPRIAAPTSWNRRPGHRIWLGDTPPTEAQRAAAPWEEDDNSTFYCADGTRRPDDGPADA